MSSQVQPNPSSVSQDHCARSPEQSGDLEGREVQVISNKTKGILYMIAGVVAIVAAVAIVCYLNAVIPATYVWPGVSKLLVAMGISALIVGGLCSLAAADQAFRRGL